MVERPVAETISVNRLLAVAREMALAITPLCDAVFMGTERVVAQEAEHVLLGFLFATDEILRFRGSVALDDGLTLSLLNWGHELEVRRPLTK